MVETPVLFETFVRVDYARQVWEAIKASQPKKLYFYSNKGRIDKKGEIEKNNEIRSWVNEIDWDCELNTWFREETVDVYTSLRGAISWLFENEECGIILEDDCVPTKAFFSFVDQMIEKFRNEDKIWCISGGNFVDESVIDDDYFFSHYHYMYGWATWANRWKKIDWTCHLKKEDITRSLFKEIYLTRKQVTFRVKELKNKINYLNSTKCWDYLFGYTIDKDKGLTVHPKYHLVTNIGINGIHHVNGIVSIINKKAEPNFDIYIINKHPIGLKGNLRVDYIIYKKLQYRSLIRKVRSSLRYRIPLYLNKFIALFK